MKTKTAHEPSVEDQIDVLDEKPAVFCLRILLAGNQVSRDVMKKVLELSRSVRHD